MYSPNNTNWDKLNFLEKLHPEKTIDDSKIHYKSTKKDYRYRIIFTKNDNTKLIFE